MIRTSVQQVILSLLLSRPAPSPTDQPHVNTGGTGNSKSMDIGPSDPRFMRLKISHIPESRERGHRGELACKRLDGRPSPSLDVTLSWLVGNALDNQERHVDYLVTLNVGWDVASVLHHVGRGPVWQLQSCGPAQHSKSLLAGIWPSKVPGLWNTRLFQVALFSFSLPGLRPPSQPLPSEARFLTFSLSPRSTGLLNDSWKCGDYHTGYFPSSPG